MSSEVQVAPFSRRATAHLFDLLLFLVALTAIDMQLPVAPPPVDAMSFYSAQDFRNYFTLVGVGIVIAMTMFLFLILGWINSTPGMWLTGLRYLGLDGKAPTLASLRKRLVLGVIYTSLIMFPGPIVAFIVAGISASVFGATFTNGAAMLKELGVPEMAQLALHTLSFIALFVALIYVFSKLSHRDMNSKSPKVSWFDRKCGSTIVVNKK